MLAGEKWISRISGKSGDIALDALSWPFRVFCSGPKCSVSSEASRVKPKVQGVGHVLLRAYLRVDLR